MRRLAKLLFVAGCLVLMTPSVSPAAGQTPAQNPDQWRYVFHNGQWWYWLPQGRWVYWQGNRWNDYSPPPPVPTAAPPSATRNQTVRTYRNQEPADSDIRPFYGHALSQWGYAPRGHDEIGPFYDHPAPSELLGAWTSRRPRPRP